MALIVMACACAGLQGMLLGVACTCLCRNHNLVTSRCWANSLHRRLPIQTLLCVGRMIVSCFLWLNGCPCRQHLW
jgi:hypothetical protein